MAFTFRVYLADGTDLDDYVAGRPDWQPGDTLYVEGLPAYRITSVIPMSDLDNGVYDGIWEVEPM